MSIPLSGLDRFHEGQMKAYIKFSETKRREHKDEIEGAFDDTRDVKVLDDMLSQEDAHRILRDIRDAVQGVSSREMAKFGRMSALYLQEIFRQAESKRILLNIDFSKLDDAVKLAGIEKILGANTEAVGRKLQSMGGGGVDVKLVEQSKTLEDKVDRLNRDFEDCTDRIKKELKANVDLKRKKDLLIQQNKDAKRDYNNAKKGDQDAMETEIDRIKGDIKVERAQSSEAALEAELENIKRELGGRIADSTQFTQLKDMIKAKNTQVKAIRSKNR
jgi:hypothetical protein